MFNHTHYVPVLKWKLGEYQALSRLTPEVKARVTPLLEIPAIGFDFENERQAKSLDDHLKDFGKRLKSKWQARRCFVDLRYIDPASRMGNGDHPLLRVMLLARTEGCEAVPVIALTSDPAYRHAVETWTAADNRGAALRIRLNDFDAPNFTADVDALLSDINLAAPSVDLIVDLAQDHIASVTMFAQTLIAAFAKLPSLNKWRSFTVAGSSFPRTLQDVTWTHHPDPDPTKKRYPDAIVPRREWSLYQELTKQLGAGLRIPTFGDYVVAHPDPVELDMRMIKPFAKLRYTTPTSWYLVKGEAVRTSGFDQYRLMCRSVTEQSFFDGQTFSDGDRYIAECEASVETTGNLTTWVWVASNRHISRVAKDLAIFHGA